MPREVLLKGLFEGGEDGDAAALDNQFDQGGEQEDD